MTKNQHKNTNFGARPREYFCLYSHQYIIRGCYNRDCKCSRCGLTHDCSKCAITYDNNEVKRRASMCSDCAIKTRQIRARIAAEKQQEQNQK